MGSEGGFRGGGGGHAGCWWRGVFGIREGDGGDCSARWARAGSHGRRSERRVPDAQGESRKTYMRIPFLAVTVTAGICTRTAFIDFRISPGQPESDLARSRLGNLIHVMPRTSGCRSRDPARDRNSDARLPVIRRGAGRPLKRPSPPHDHAPWRERTASIVANSYIVQRELLPPRPFDHRRGRHLVLGAHEHALCVLAGAAARCCGRARGAWGGCGRGHGNGGGDGSGNGRGSGRHGHTGWRRGDPCSEGRRERGGRDVRRGSVLRRRRRRRGLRLGLGLGLGLGLLLGRGGLWARGGEAERHLRVRGSVDRLAALRGRAPAAGEEGALLRAEPGAGVDVRAAEEARADLVLELARAVLVLCEGAVDARDDIDVFEAGRRGGEHEHELVPRGRRGEGCGACEGRGGRGELCRVQVSARSAASVRAYREGRTA